MSPGFHGCNNLTLYAGRQFIRLFALTIEGGKPDNPIPPGGIQKINPLPWFPKGKIPQQVTDSIPVWIYKNETLFLPRKGSANALNALTLTATAFTPTM